MKQTSYFLAALLGAGMLFGAGCARDYNGYNEEYGVSPAFEEEGFQEDGVIEDGIFEDEGIIDSDEEFIEDEGL